MLTKFDDELFKTGSKVVIGCNVEGIVNQHHEDELCWDINTLMMKSMMKDPFKAQ